MLRAPCKDNSGFSLSCTTADLCERWHYSVLHLFSLAPNNPSYSLSSNLASFCSPVSRSLPPRDISWLHVLQINTSSLAAGVSQNLLGGAARGEPVPSPALLFVGRQRSTAKGPASQPLRWKTSTGMSVLSEAELCPMALPTALPPSFHPCTLTGPGWQSEGREDGHGLPASTLSSSCTYQQDVDTQRRLRHRRGSRHAASQGSDSCGGVLGMTHPARSNTSQAIYNPRFQRLKIALLLFLHFQADPRLHIHATPPTGSTLNTAQPVWAAREGAPQPPAESRAQLPSAPFPSATVIRAPGPNSAYFHLQTGSSKSTQPGTGSSACSRSCFSQEEHAAPRALPLSAAAAASLKELPGPAIKQS